MKVEELTALAQIGAAIWAEPEIAERTTSETLMAVSLQDYEPERIIEKVASVLLERASRQGTATLTQQNFSQIGKPFYRLEHEKRFILSALHVGRWSYDRISRVMGIPREQVEELAWGSRMELAALGVIGGSRTGVSTAGAKPNTPNCPEHDMRRPWTQRFLDEEFSTGTERFFLQSHLLQCTQCKQSLNRCREIYFSVEALIPRLAEGPAAVKNLNAVFEKAMHLKFPTERDFASSIRIFVARREVQVALAGLAVLALLKVLS